MERDRDGERNRKGETWDGETETEGDRTASLFLMSAVRTVFSYDA